MKIPTSLLIIFILLIPIPALSKKVHLDCYIHTLCEYYPESKILNKSCEPYDHDFVIIFNEKKDIAQLAGINFDIDLNVLQVRDSSIVLGSTEYTKKYYDNPFEPFKGDYYIWSISRISGKGTRLYVNAKGKDEQLNKFICTTKDKNLF